MLEMIVKAVIAFLLAFTSLHISESKASNNTCNLMVVSSLELSEMETLSSRKPNQEEQTLPAEYRLFHHLLLAKKKHDYIKQVRPIADHNSQIILRFGICLMSIDDIIEKDQTMLSTGCIKMKWTDEFLSWNPADFDNLTGIIFPSENIWIPDIALVNSPNPFAMAKKPSNVEISFDGQVGYYPAGQFETRCPVGLSYFPFDNQICEFHFESWAYPQNLLKIVLWPNQSIDQKGWLSNHQWQLKEINTRLHAQIYDGISFDALTFRFSFRRRSLYYTIYAIFPGFLMALLQLTSMTLPLEHPGRMGVLTALFIGFTVLQGYIAKSMPKSSDSISLIQSYLMICSLTIVFSIVQTGINMHLFFRTPEHSEPSVLAWLKSYFISFGIRPEQIASAYPKPARCVPTFPRSINGNPDVKEDRSRVAASPGTSGTCPYQYKTEDQSSKHDREPAEKEKATPKPNVRNRWLSFAAKFDRLSFYGLALLHSLSPVYLFVISPVFQDLVENTTSNLGYMTHDESV